MNNTTTIYPEYAAPLKTLIHISDTHLVQEKTIYDSSADPAGYLKLLISRLEESKIIPSALIFSGDIADQGELQMYEEASAIVTAYANRVGAELIWAMGNHDDRTNFRRGLLQEAPSQSPVDHITWLGDLRIITLDTSVPGFHHGELQATQLSWLKRELSTPAAEGTILVMHHAPVPSILKLASTVELRNQKDLAEVIKGSDIRSILAGHLHYSCNTLFAGIPVSVATSSCYTQDLIKDIGGTRGRDSAQGFNLVHVYPEIILHSVIPLSEGLEVGQFVNSQEAQEIIDSYFG